MRYNYAGMLRFLRSARYSNKKRSNKPYAPKSIEKKVETMRKIVEDGLDKEALLNISKSKHVPSDVREKAKGFL